MEGRLEVLAVLLQRQGRVLDYQAQRLNLLAVKVDSLETLKRVQLQRPHAVSYKPLTLPTNLRVLILVVLVYR